MSDTSNSLSHKAHDKLGKITPLLFKVDLVGNLPQSNLQEKKGTFVGMVYLLKVKYKDGQLG